MRKIYIFGFLTLSFIFSFPFIFNVPTSYSADSENPASGGYHLIITCTGGQPIAGSNSGEKECTFTDVVAQINHLINFLFYAATLIATIAFIYCGFLFLTDGGSGAKTKQAKDVFFKVVVGFFWIFCAWLVVQFIVGAFELNDGYSLLK